MLHCCVYLFISIALVTVIICSCIHDCFHAFLFASLLAVQAECEALRAEAVKWEGEAKSLSSMQDVSIYIEFHMQFCHFYYCILTSHVVQ